MSSGVLGLESLSSGVSSALIYHGNLKRGADLLDTHFAHQALYVDVIFSSVAYLLPEINFSSVTQWTR